MCERLADIKENDIWQQMPDILIALLKDHTTSTAKETHNIFWATDDYASLGEGYGYMDEIAPELITGEHGLTIVPRVLKDESIQGERKRDRGEIFTPLWIVNSQLNLVDNAWFNRQDVFNVENDDHTWTPTHEPIRFPDDASKTWRDYVLDTRLEITCGEGPYLTSRYDPTTGELLPVHLRIGIVDRKLRIVSENTQSTGEWLKAAREALQSSYGYEWQGDSLLLAREAIFYTWLEHFQAKFGPTKMPPEKSCKSAAYIISWNTFQMDGLKCVVPCSCHDDVTRNLFGDETVTPCRGCQTGNIKTHNGKYCVIRDWRTKPTDAAHGTSKKMRFVELIK